MDALTTTRLHLRPTELTSGVLCAVIFKQFGASIRVQKEHVAVPNLEKIILAAVDIGRRKGFHSTTTRDLAEASGLSMGAIYSYVQSKETLLRMTTKLITTLWPITSMPCTNKNSCSTKQHGDL
jgi:hypothetical protein